MPPDSDSRFERSLRHAPLTAALLAAIAALPGLWLPFLADDWGLLADAARGSLARTPFGYFRPLTTLSFRAELSLWGPSPFFFHLTNLALAAACAFLLVVLLRRLTGDAYLAAAAGALFALHPYHVENVWWVAGRADLLACFFLLAATLSTLPWRNAGHVRPLPVMILFEAALLSKEAAISFPFVLLLVELARNRWKLQKAVWRVFLGLLGVALVHVFGIRRSFLGAAAFATLKGTARYWTGNFLAFAAGSLAPLHTEFLEGHPLRYGSLGIALASATLFWAFARDRRLGRIAMVAALAFLLLLAPVLLSFQERYLYLPSAALGLFLAALGMALPLPIRRIVLSALGTIWMGILAWHAMAWADSARVSSRLIADLKAASLEDNVRGILVANMPHRVHGVPVAANFREAVVLSGGRQVPIKAATALDFPSSRQDGLAGGFSGAITRSSDQLVVGLEVPARRFSRVVLPLPGRSVAKDADGEWEVTVEGGGKLRVRLPLPARSALRAWTAGGLRSLEAP